MSQKQRDLSRLFVSAEETKEPEKAQLKGEIPVRGTLIQTGPGLFDLPNFTLNNFQDGYAILSVFSIREDGVILTKKFPVTESYEKALQHGKPYFVEFGTTAKREGSKGGLFSKLVTTFSRDDMSDNCLASVYRCGSHIIASSATTFLSRIDPLTLSCERYDAKKYLGQNGYLCHPLIDEEDGVMYNMGFTVLPLVKYNVVKIPKANSTDLKMEEILSKGTTIASVGSRFSGALAFNHSFGMTKKYIIFIEQPYVIKISRVLSATMKDLPVKDWLEWRGSEKNRFYIIEKATGKILSTEYLSTESFFFLHIINCFEDEDKIIVDIATSKTPSSTEATHLEKLRNNMIDEVDPFTIERFIIPVIDNIKNADVPENCNLLKDSTHAKAVRNGATISLTSEIIFIRGADRAVINPKRIGKQYKYIYASGSFLSLPHEENAGMAHSICKINVDTKDILLWSASEDHFPAEPVVIPNKGGDEEDDAVIVAAVSSAKTGLKDFLVFLDAKTLKEIGRASFDSQIPICMHALFIKD